MTAGWPLAKACRQGPAAKVSWLSSRAWARGSEALAQRSLPSASPSMIPAASTSNSCLAATTARSRVLVRSCSGSRSVRVAMLVASIEGSIGMMGAFGSGRRTGEPGQQARQQVALGADQAQQPHAVVVWASADPVDGSNENQPCQLTPGPARVALLPGWYYRPPCPTTPTCLGRLRS
jgi:hypothetical protein